MPRGECYSYEYELKVSGIHSSNVSKRIQFNLTKSSLVEKILAMDESVFVITSDDELIEWQNGTIRTIGRNVKDVCLDASKDGTLIVLDVNQMIGSLDRTRELQVLSTAE
ncbi:hypothetical protein ACOME3_004627 [Neoechinorhynchus agilis]